VSFVTTQPEALMSSAGNLQGIGSAMSAANAAAPTATQFAAHAQMYQALSAPAAVIHEMFVNTLGTNAGSYAATEAANAAAAS
jgi:PE family